VPSEELTFPPWEFSEVEQLGLTPEEQLRYADVFEDEPNGLRHRLLGHADPQQGDMQLECQLVTNGLYAGDESGYNDPRAEVLAPGATSWRLLLQIDTDDDVSMMWGDAGQLYWWMHKDAMRSRAWNASHLILQCG
jgi:uncharacterized protein YwqG